MKLKTQDIHDDDIQAVMKDGQSMRARHERTRSKLNKLEGKI